MKTYKITFTGRLLNAIGCFYPITAVVKAESEKKAVLALYDTYDHITNPKVTEIEAIINEPREE